MEKIENHKKAYAGRGPATKWEIPIDNFRWKMQKLIESKMVNDRTIALPSFCAKAFFAGFLQPFSSCWLRCRARRRLFFYSSWITSIVSAFLFSNCTPFTLNAQQYVGVSGEVHMIQRTWPRPNAKPPSSTWKGDTNEWTINFEAVIGTNQWQLAGNFTRNGYETWVFDGTNLTIGTRIVKDLSKQFATNSFAAFLPSLDQVKSNLTVSIKEYEGFPRADIGVNILWLALCSGSYLRIEGRTMPMTAAYVGHAYDAFGYSDVIETYKDALGLPKKVDFYTSAARYEASVRKYFAPRFGKLKNFQPSGDPDGLLKFHYLATQSTNIAGWEFPVTFKFGEDLPETFGPALRTHSGYGTITQLFASSPPHGAFDPSYNQTVIDWRFHSKTKDVDAIMYRSTNTVVAPTNDPELQSRFATTLNKAPAKPAMRQARVRPLTWCLLAVAALLLLSFLIIKRKPKILPLELNHEN